MSLTKEQQDSVLRVARTLIGMKYSDLDCSHFVHRAYSTAKLEYPYAPTAAFSSLVDNYFVEITTAQSSFEPADVLMFSGHVGLWDPEGCSVLKSSGAPDGECTKFDDKIPFLSSRSGNNRGPEFGMLKWFGNLKTAYRWKG